MRMKFLAIVLIQAMLLAGMIAYKQYWLTRGERILLRTVPVDPRDIFRGDYVQLRYDISSIDLDKLPAHESLKINENIYVIVGKDTDGTFKAISVSKLLSKDKTFIMGKITNVVPRHAQWELVFRNASSGNQYKKVIGYEPNLKKEDHLKACFDTEGNIISFGSGFYCGKDKATDIIVDDIRNLTSGLGLINVEYGIESYFVEEGKGKAIETARNARNLKVEVALDKTGKGIITRLFMDGVEIK